MAEPGLLQVSFIALEVTSEPSQGQTQVGDCSRDRAIGSSEEAGLFQHGLKT